MFGVGLGLGSLRFFDVCFGSVWFVSPLQGLVLHWSFLFLSYMDPPLPEGVPWRKLGFSFSADPASRVLLAVSAVMFCSCLSCCRSCC